MSVRKGYKQTEEHKRKRFASARPYWKSKAAVRNGRKAAAASHRRYEAEWDDLRTMSGLSHCALIGIKKKFRVQRADAKRRGIDFGLSFKQWLLLWARSGRLDERGTRAGQYVMARKGDRGSYSVGNVEIILASKNTSDRHVNQAGF